MHSVWRDFRYGARLLSKRSGFATTAILTLALGIGANTAMFSIVRDLLLKPLTIPNPDQIVRVYMHFHPQDMDLGTMADSDFRDLEILNHSFQSLGLFLEGAPFEITGSGETQLVSGAFATSGFFSTLEQAPLLGRVFLPQDEMPNSGPVVILSEALWRGLFNANPNAIGQTIHLGNQNFTIVGVMPRSFRFPSDKDELWANYAFDPLTKRGPWFSYGIARLKPGVNLERAQADVNAIGRRIEQANPTLYSNLTLPLIPLRESIIADVRPSLLLMFAAVFVVFLIAVVNVSNLLLVHGASRRREIAIRRSLGAAHLRIALQLFAESISLLSLGGALGFSFAYGAIRLVRRFNPENISEVRDIHFDASVLTFAGLLTLGAWILCTLGPVFLNSRVDLNVALKCAGSFPSPAGPRALSTLVVCEIALSAVLLVCTGLLLRSFLELQKVNPGFHAPPKNILVLKFFITQSRPFNPEDWLAIYQRLLVNVQGLPGVTSAALSRSVPPDSGCGCSPFMIEGQPWTPGAYPAFPYVAVTENYFSSLAIPLLKGRAFSAQDQPESRRVAIISNSLARRYFPNQDPIGKRIKLGGPEDRKWPYLEIVGVVGDVKYLGLARPFEPACYVPLTQDVENVFLVVRSALPASTVAQEVRAAIKTSGSDVVFVGMNTMEQLLSNSVAAPRLRTTLVAIFASVALLLAAIGVYGVLAYSVAHRRREIGVRMALGAQTGDVLRLVVGHGLKIAWLGLAIGAATSFAFTFVLRKLLFRVKPTDPITFLAVCIVLMLAALAACYLPARRALRVDPLIALHYE
jgi:putative ABC transport system permease protein